jgi:hypothetical protein
VLFKLGLLGTVFMCVAGLLLLPTLLLQLTSLFAGDSHTDAHSLPAAITAEFFLLSWVA